MGEIIGANFDPQPSVSGRVWIPSWPYSIRGRAPSYHFHAKDTKIDAINTARNGVLDTKHYGDEIHRSWIFRSVGYGNDSEYWKDIISALDMVGYDDAIVDRA